MKSRLGDLALQRRLFLIALTADAVPVFLSAVMAVFWRHVKFSGLASLGEVAITSLYATTAVGLLHIALPFALVYALYTPLDLRREYASMLATLLAAAPLGILLGATLGYAAGALAFGLTWGELVSELLSALGTLGALWVLAVRAMLFMVSLEFTAATIAYVRRAPLHSTQ